MSNETVRATVFLQVAPDVNRYFSNESEHFIRGAKVVGSTQKRSSKPQGGTIEVKITIEIPKAAFLPLRPEAIVVVPESMTTAHPVIVEAADANEAS